MLNEIISLHYYIHDKTISNLKKKNRNPQVKVNLSQSLFLFLVFVLKEFTYWNEKQRINKGKKKWTNMNLDGTWTPFLPETCIDIYIKAYAWI